MLKDTTGGVYLYQKGAEIVPDGIEKYMSLAAAYYAMGKYEEVIVFSDKALEIDPNNSIVNMSLIQMFFYRKQYAKTFDYLAAIQTIPDDARGDSQYHKQNGLYLLAKSSYFLEKYEQAERLAKESIIINPSNGYPYATLAETYSRMGKEEAFYEALENALKRGILIKTLMGEAPYQRFLNQQRFKDLVKKYEKKEQELDPIVKN